MDNANSLTFEQVCVRGIVVVFSLANIAAYMSCPHYLEIEGTSLEGEFDLDVMAQTLTGDDDAQLPENNRPNLLQLLPAFCAFYKVCYGNWLPTPI